MGRKATGAHYEKDGVRYASITYAHKKRKSVPLPTCSTPEQAAERSRAIAVMVAKLRRSELPEGAILNFIDQAASSTEARLVAVLETVDEIAQEPALDPGTTFADVADDWTSGKLARMFPEHVKPVDHTRNANVSRLSKFITPIVGNVPIKSFRIEHAERVLANPKLPAGSRRHVAQLVQHVLALAVYPLKLIVASPIPRGWLPKKRKAKAGAFLLPAEDAALLRCVAVPLRRRVLFGVLAREGMRRSEATSLRWEDLDLKHGTVRLDANKTDDPRMWVMRPDVVRALKKWEKLSPSAPFDFYTNQLAAQLRDDLGTAKVKRPELNERNDTRMRLRAHDLRATFITLSLANGRTEAWVADRTGHKSSEMINRYRRPARTLTEMKVGELLAMDTLIPELHSVGKVRRASKSAGKK